MKYQKFLSVFVALVAMGLQSTAHAIRIDTQSIPLMAHGSSSLGGNIPEKIDPIRFGQGTLKIVRSVLTVDPDTGVGNVVHTEVCRKIFAAPVYDMRKTPKMSYIDPEQIQCMDTLEGTPVQITSVGVVALSSGEYLRHTEDLKIALGWSWVGVHPGSVIPEIPVQSTYTPDLSQKFFGVFASPGTSIICETNGLVEPPTSEPKKGRKCRAVHPVTYEVQLELLDDRQ